ncbi:predicted protein [Naegleria gruberi]|uniref:Predicted protein n=1 Tax=Naegleria gruberi TaxID=5762 RepID=D2W1B0_NAEGR|nr:uncharacterized protein NAEGRDRAFT_75152 [Naegleria gruberi]EFC37154.1 predicted protein [Naegleria gruberi]|eukprot:XP_002669898.1 predicted protein [Naegleria gruberi strain NEG-M]
MRAILCHLFIICCMSIVVACQQQQPTNGTLGFIYSLNSTKSVSYLLPNIGGTISCMVEGDSVLYGEFSLSESTVKPGYTWTNSNYNKPLSPVAFFTLNLSQVFIPPNVTEDQIDFETSFMVNWKSFIPTSFNLDPTSYEIRKYYASANSFYPFSTYAPKDYGTLVQIEDASEIVITFGIFVFNSMQKVSFDEYVAINYPRSLWLDNYSSDNIKNVSYNFPLASYTPHALTNNVIKVIRGSTGSKGAVPSNYAILGLFLYRTYEGHTSNITLTQSSVSISYEKSQYYLDFSYKMVDIDIDTLTCQFIAYNSLTSLKKTLTKDQLICDLDNSYSQNHDLYIIAKLKPKPPTPPTPQPSNNNNGNKKTILMVTGFEETLTLTKGQEQVFHVFASSKKKNLIHFDAKLTNGNGIISNIYSYNVYLLVSNTDLLATDCKFSITPNVTSLPGSTDPNNNSNLFSIEQILVIVLPIVVGGGVMVCAIVAFIIVALVVYRKRRNTTTSDMNVQLMQTTPYYEISRQ